MSLGGLERLCNNTGLIIKRSLAHSADPHSICAQWRANESPHRVSVATRRERLIRTKSDGKLWHQREGKERAEDRLSFDSDLLEPGRQQGCVGNLADHLMHAHTPSALREHLPHASIF